MPVLVPIKIFFLVPAPVALELSVPVPVFGCRCRRDFIPAPRGMPVGEWYRTSEEGFGFEKDLALRFVPNRPNETDEKRYLNLYPPPQQ